MPQLDEWIAAETRIATGRMLGAISATHLLMERPGFGQRVVPSPGSVLASPAVAHYDPDPDYFFHWFRDSAIVIDALRVALAAGYAQPSAAAHFQEFLQFTRSLQTLDGGEFLRRSDLRARAQPAFLQYLRAEAEIAALSGDAVSADVRVNADGTPDFIRWSRPQADGPAMRCITLLRWRRQFAELERDSGCRVLLGELIGSDLAFTRARVQLPFSGIWEEQSGYHYYTQLLQAEALMRGAEWLDEAGNSAEAHACRMAGEQTHARLDGFWDEAAGFYRACAGGGPGERVELDSAVILAVLHADRPGGAHSVLDPRVQATLTALEELFEARYAINRERPPGRGPAMGRYADDRYYSGGAWFLTTLAAAELYFKLAQSLRRGARTSGITANARFRQRLGTAELSGERAARLAMECGDAIMRTVRAFTPESGDLSEQFDQTTGAQTSAKHLSWSYAAFITAAASRAQASQLRLS